MAKPSSPTLSIKKITVFFIILSLLILGAFAYWKMNEVENNTLNGKYPAGFGPDNCKPGHPCVMEEDEGKKKVAETPEVQALVAKHGGWEHVHIGALDIDLVRHTDFIEKIYPNLAADTGCIIIVHAGDEGYVYREDKNLNIAYEETLAQFLERTKDFDAQYMAKFYLSLH